MFVWFVSEPPHDVPGVFTPVRDCVPSLQQPRHACNCFRSWRWVLCWKGLLIPLALLQYKEVLTEEGVPHFSTNAPKKQSILGNVCLNLLQQLSADETSPDDAFGAGWAEVWSRAKHGLKVDVLSGQGGSNYKHSRLQQTPLRWGDTCTWLYVSSEKTSPFDFSPLMIWNHDKGGGGVDVLPPRHGRWTNTITDSLTSFSFRNTPVYFPWKSTRGIKIKPKPWENAHRGWFGSRVQEKLWEGQYSGIRRLPMSSFLFYFPFCAAYWNRQPTFPFSTPRFSRFTGPWGATLAAASSGQ